MMHKAWSSIEEVPYCFSRSYVKLQGHTAKKIVEFDPYWAFPDSNSSLNSPMAMKCCTKLETAKERCSIVFQGHQSNFKVTRDKTSPILTQIGRFRTIGRSQLSNPSDLPCSHWLHILLAIQMIMQDCAWWRHQMETFSALLALCTGNSLVTSEFPSQRPLRWSVDIFFDVPLTKRLSKQSRGWWFEMPSSSLWHHCNE